VGEATGLMGMLSLWILESPNKTGAFGFITKYLNFTRFLKMEVECLITSFI
jgi:hypothetical protein